MISISLSKIASPRNIRYLLIVLVSGLVLLFSHNRAFERYELQTYDWRFHLRGPRYTSPQIVHVDIYNDSLLALGRWPFDRMYHAALIDALKDSGVRAVLFDIEFAEPTDSDKVLIQKTTEAGNVYLVYGLGGLDLYPEGWISDRFEAQLSESFEKAAKGTGFVNNQADIDGKRRRVMPLIRYYGNEPARYKNKLLMQVGFQLYADYLGVKPKEIRFRPGHSLELGDKLKIPLDDESNFIVNYAGFWESENGFKHYSYVDILQSHNAAILGEKPVMDLSVLRDKICVVGLAAQGTTDVYPNPLEKMYPGVGTYSNVINSLITRDFIRRADRNINLLIMVVLCAMLVRIAFYKKPILSFIYATSLISIFILSAINIFIYYGVWLDLFYPSLALVGVYTLTTLSRITSEMRKRELMETELKIASQIQKSFLPAAPPEIKGLSLSVFMQPAKHVGGDLYAFIKLPDDKVGVMLGDVSGKGTPAALFMGKVVSEFKFSARDRVDPAEVLTNLNNSISAESTGGLFVTLAYAVFDLKNMKMTLANGGHLPLVVTYPDKRAELITGDSGMPIGVMEGVPFANIEVPIAPGQSFALYSDGISEARNRKKDEFGVEELQKVMLENYKKTSQEILDRSVDSVKHFAGKADQHDDMTMIVVQIVGEPKA